MEFTPWPLEAGSGDWAVGRILLGGAGPVELATGVKVVAPFKKGFVDGLAPGQCPRAQLLKPLSD